MQSIHIHRLLSGLVVLTKGEALPCANSYYRCCPIQRGSDIIIIVIIKYWTPRSSSSIVITLIWQIGLYI